MVLSVKWYQRELAELKELKGSLKFTSVSVDPQSIFTLGL